MDQVTEDDAVMQEEIFGPLLPILTVGSMEEAIAFVNRRPKPLALYLFTENRETEKNVLELILPLEAAASPDTIIHLATPKWDLAAFGNSGMGTYHGKKSFETIQP